MTTRSGPRAEQAAPETAATDTLVLHEAPTVVRSRRAGPWVVVAIVGEMDVASVPRLAAVCGDSRRVVLDLHEVTFMDCAGLGALVGARHRAASAGGAVRLVAPPWDVRRILALTDLEGDLPSFDTMTEALSRPVAHAS